MGFTNKQAAYKHHTHIHPTHTHTHKYTLTHTHTQNIATAKLSIIIK